MNNSVRPPLCPLPHPRPLPKGRGAFLYVVLGGAEAPPKTTKRTSLPAPGVNKDYRGFLAPMGAKKPPTKMLPSPRGGAEGGGFAPEGEL